MRTQRINDRRYLGELCEHGHTYTFVWTTTDGEIKKELQVSVRYKNCRTCCTCNALSVVAGKKRYAKYRKKNKAKMAKYQAARRKKARLERSTANMFSTLVKGA